MMGFHSVGAHYCFCFGDIGLGIFVTILATGTLEIRNNKEYVEPAVSIYRMYVHIGQGEETASELDFACE